MYSSRLPLTSSAVSVSLASSTACFASLSSCSRSSSASAAASIEGPASSRPVFGIFMCSGELALPGARVVVECAVCCKSLVIEPPGCFFCFVLFVFFFIGIAVLGWLRLELLPERSHLEQRALIARGPERLIHEECLRPIVLARLDAWRRVELQPLVEVEPQVQVRREQMPPRRAVVGVHHEARARERA